MSYFEYWKLEKAIPDNVCDLLISLGNWESAAIKTGVNEYGVDKDLRESDITWIKDNFWMSTFFGFFQSLNMESFKFEINSVEPLQLTRYKAPTNHYDFHIDGDGFNAYREGSINTRKLSMSVLLNDDFEGGVFQYYITQKPTDVPFEKGDILIFPSYYLHRVKPVTKGTRYSLVSWALGPKIK
jgi:PKHD-type hydroxylase